MATRTSVMSPITNYSTSKYIPAARTPRRSTGVGSTYSSSFGSTGSAYTSPLSRPPAYPSTRTTNYTSDVSRFSTTRKTPTSLRTVTSPRPPTLNRGAATDNLLSSRNTTSRISPVKHYGSSTFTTTHSLGSSRHDSNASSTNTTPRSRHVRAGSVSDIRATFENLNTNANQSSSSSSLTRSRRFGSHTDLTGSSVNSTPRTSTTNTPEKHREDLLYDTGGGSRHVASKNYYNTSSRTYDYKSRENGVDALPEIRPTRTYHHGSRSMTRSPSSDRALGGSSSRVIENGDVSPTSYTSSRRTSLTYLHRQNSINSSPTSNSVFSTPGFSYISESPSSYSAASTYLSACSSFAKSSTSGAGSVSRDSQEISSTSAMASRGLVGLRNVGNTCFMNSIVQCLSNTKLLLEYCLNDEYQDDINTTTSNMKGALINAYTKLMKSLWKTSGESYVSPTEFKSQVQKFAPRFTGYNQQDSQEFLIYLLEGLHEDVNRVTEKRKPVVIKDEEGEEKISASEKARETWKRYLSRENSRIVDIFVGQLKSCLTCTTCGYQSNTFDPLWQLSLPIKKRGVSDVSLQDCLDLFTHEEILDGDEKPTCARCKQRRKCTKSFSIQKFPKVLVVHLKRFNHESLFRSKLSTHVDFPLNDLDLSPYAAERGGPPVLYDLYAVSNHSGTPLSGHYTAYAKHPYSGEWHCFNDQRVSSIPSNRVKSAEGYVLFYELSSQSARL